MSINDFAYYQITCGHTDTKEAFELRMGEFLVELRTQVDVSVTINAIIHSNCIYVAKGKAIHEPSAVVLVSINPNHNPNRDGVPAVREALPFVELLAEKMRKHYDQFVVPFSAISPAWTVGAASKSQHSKERK